MRVYRFSTRRISLTLILFFSWSKKESERDTETKIPRTFLLLNIKKISSVFMSKLNIRTCQKEKKKTNVEKLSQN